MLKSSLTLGVVMVLGFLDIRWWVLAFGAATGALLLATYWRMRDKRDADE